MMRFSKMSTKFRVKVPMSHQLFLEIPSLKHLVLLSRFSFPYYYPATLYIKVFIISRRFYSFFFCAIPKEYCENKNSKLKSNWNLIYFPSNWCTLQDPLLLRYLKYDFISQQFLYLQMWKPPTVLH